MHVQMVVQNAPFFKNVFKSLSCRIDVSRETFWLAYSKVKEPESRLLEPYLSFDNPGIHMLNYKDQMLAYYNEEREQHYDYWYRPRGLCD